jgi:hypothetical protein
MPRGCTFPRTVNRRTEILAAAGGLVAALAGDVAVRKVMPRYRSAGSAVGLTIAAAIYPLARGRWTAGAAPAREIAALVVFSALAASVARGAADLRTRGALAAGWSAHAAFDMLHDSGDDSRIPAWYPALCAGYDLGVAGCLLAKP